MAALIHRKIPCLHARDHMTIHPIEPIHQFTKDSKHEVGLPRQFHPEIWITPAPNLIRMPGKGLFFEPGVGIFARTAQQPFHIMSLSNYPAFDLPVWQFLQPISRHVQISRDGFGKIFHFSPPSRKYAHTRISTLCIGPRRSSVPQREFFHRLLLDAFPTRTGQA